MTTGYERAEFNRLCEAMTGAHVYQNADALVGFVLAIDKDLLKQLPSEIKYLVFLDHEDQYDLVGIRHAATMREIDDTLKFISSRIFTYHARRYLTNNDMNTTVAAFIDKLHKQIRSSSRHELPDKILGYWLVSDWLADELVEYGEIVFEFAGLKIWGRQIARTLISTDEVIRIIVAANQDIL